MVPQYGRGRHSALVMFIVTALVTQSNRHYISVGMVSDRLI